MILPFSTQINGKPTCFIQRIWACLLQIDYDLYDDYLHPDGFPPQMPWPPSSYKNFTPKRHSIREDKNNRWKVGTKIDFFINARQKNMFRFAPVLPVVSTQKVEFIWKDNTENLSCLGITYDRTCTIMIDDKFYADAYLLNDWVVSSSYNLKDFANNDGFDTIEDFFAYFNENYTGKLIHWTNLKY